MHISVGICSNIPSGGGLPYLFPSRHPGFGPGHSTPANFTKQACTGGCNLRATCIPSGTILPDDHFGLQQYRHHRHHESLLQTQGEVYWLAILVYLDSGSSPDCRFGWNTSNSPHPWTTPFTSTAHWATALGQAGGSLDERFAGPGLRRCTPLNRQAWCCWPWGGLGGNRARRR